MLYSVYVGKGTKSLRPRGSLGIVTGAAGGAFSGLTGVGGGAVMVPLLTGGLKLSQHRAHGTSLAIIVFIAASGAIGYWQAGNIDWRLVITVTPGAVAGVYVGARAMMKVPGPQLRLLFAVFLLFVAFRQLAWDAQAGTAQSGAPAVAIEIALGFTGGLLSGVLGVGGGAIFVPAMLIFGLVHAAAGEDPQKVAQGVSLVVIVATGIAGTATNLRHGAVDRDVVATVAPAAVVAAFAASLLANRLDDRLLQVAFGLTALAIGAQFAYTSIRELNGRTITERV